MKSEKDMDISVKKVVSKKDLMEFIKLPWKIYEDMPHWVPPLISEMKHRFDENKNPYYDHAEVELYLALMDNDIVGRIACHIDKLHNDFHKEKAAFFGFFETLNDSRIAAKLYETAEKWGKERGMELLRGPMSFGTNDECAFLLEGFDSDPAVMMTYSPKYYLELTEGEGFVKAKDLLAFYKSTEDPMDPRMEKHAKRIAEDPTIHVRKFEKKNFKREMEYIKEVYDAAWEPNWGFVPMTERELEETSKVLLEYADTDLVWFAEKTHEDGKIEPIGISIVLPNLNEATKSLNGKLGPIEILKFLAAKKKIKGTRAILFGLKRHAQGFGIPALLLMKTEDEARRKGYKWCEMSWNLEDNVKINTFDKGIGGRIYKKYRIYEKKI